MRKKHKRKSWVSKEKRYKKKPKLQKKSKIFKYKPPYKRKRTKVKKGVKRLMRIESFEKEYKHGIYDPYYLQARKKRIIKRAKKKNKNKTKT